MFNVVTTPETMILSQYIFTYVYILPFDRADSFQDYPGSYELQNVWIPP